MVVDGVQRMGIVQLEQDLPNVDNARGHQM
jgi:hypothetical protein